MVLLLGVFVAAALWQPSSLSGSAIWTPRSFGDAPEQPEPETSAPAPAPPFRTLPRAQGIALGDGLAYIGFGNRLLVIDASDPSDPRPVGGSAALSGEPFRLVAGGALVFATSKARFLGVFDPSSPGVPRIITRYSTGLLVIDVSDPTLPREVAVYETPLPGRGLALTGQTAYLAAGELHILDVSDPGAPRLLGLFSQTTRFPTEPELAWVALSEGITHVLPDGVDGQSYIVDVSDPHHPSVLAAYPRCCSTGRPHLHPPYAYYQVGGRSGGVHIIDVSNPRDPTFAAYIGVEGAFAISDHWGYVAEPQRGEVLSCAPPGYIDGVPRGATWMLAPPALAVADLSDPRHPVLVTNPTPGEPIASVDWGGDMAIAGDYAYVVGPKGVFVFDLSVPTEPRQVGCLFFDPAVFY